MLLSLSLSSWARGSERPVLVTDGRELDRSPQGGPGVGQKVEVLTKEQTARVLWPATEALLALTLPQSPGSPSLSERLEGQGSGACGDPGSPRASPEDPRSRVLLPHGGISWFFPRRSPTRRVRLSILSCSL